MTQGCCGDDVRQIRVAGVQVGLRGLNALLERLYVEGFLPEDAGIDGVIAKGLREAGNYVPASAEAVYAEAVKQLFRERVEANKAGGR